MSFSMIKREFCQWITTLDQFTLSDIDKKFINLLINHFDEIAPLGTAGGLRAKKIGKLIEKKHEILSSDLPNLNNQQASSAKVYKNIYELKIGPFRGFSSEEVFTFDKKYTFMYGPNGSGKSSFCEGLEFALLGSIEESDVKKISLPTYIKNIQSEKKAKSAVYGLNSNKEKVEISQNPNAYRFSFIEKNRIDSFARISATSPSVQQNRIAILFGLDAFSKFVDGFTDEFDDRYITLVNQKKNDFNEEKQKNKIAKTEIAKIKARLIEQGEKANTLIKEVSQEKISNLEELKVFLIGEDNTSGIINDLHTKKAASVPDNIDSSIIEIIKKKLNELDESCMLLDLKLTKYARVSSKLNFKELYSAIESIKKDTSIDKSICPACKTPINKVVLNPFENAASELEKMKELTILQDKIESLAILLLSGVREANDYIKEINNDKKTINSNEPLLPEFTEFFFTDITAIDSWKETFTKELKTIIKTLSNNVNLESDIRDYNLSLEKKRINKKKIGNEIKKYQNFKQRLDEIISAKKTLSDNKNELETEINNFLAENEVKIKQIEDLDRRIAINEEYVQSYNKLIKKLKQYRDELPAQLAGGLSDLTKEFYNIINAHDPDFEKIESLTLPIAAGEKIIIRFQGDDKEYDALLILSEGHIKILGLSILLSKVVNDNLGFIIFDDVVNAIDDEHRDGIADLLLKNPALKDRQHIITCHGEIFIKKLEHKLGASIASKDVKIYRFVPTDSVEERGVKISIGDSKHYLLLAKQSLDKDDRKDAALRCRQAIESLSEQLWKKLNNKLGTGLTVKMLKPGGKPFISSVVDGLIRELKKIADPDNLLSDFLQIKEKYPWCLMQKGAHEEDGLPEFERIDIFHLINLVTDIETKVHRIKLEVSNVLS